MTTPAKGRGAACSALLYQCLPGDGQCPGLDHSTPAALCHITHLSKTPPRHTTALRRAAPLWVAQHRFGSCSTVPHSDPRHLIATFLSSLRISARGAMRRRENHSQHASQHQFVLATVPRQCQRRSRGRRRVCHYKARGRRPLRVLYLQRRHKALRLVHNKGRLSAASRRSRRS